MERIIKENFMAEWEIEAEINYRKKLMKEHKETFWRNISDESIDQICNFIIESINIQFYKIRNNINDDE